MSSEYYTKLISRLDRYGTIASIAEAFGWLIITIGGLIGFYVALDSNTIGSIILSFLVFFFPAFSGGIIIVLLANISSSLSVTGAEKLEHLLESQKG